MPPPQVLQIRSTAGDTANVLSSGTTVYEVGDDHGALVFDRDRKRAASVRFWQ